MSLLHVGSVRILAQGHIVLFTLSGTELSACTLVQRLWAGEKSPAGILTPFRIGSASPISRSGKIPSLQSKKEEKATKIHWCRILQPWHLSENHRTYCVFCDSRNFWHHTLWSSLLTHTAPPLGVSSHEMDLAAPCGRSDLIAENSPPQKRQGVGLDQEIGCHVVVLGGAFFLVSYCSLNWIKLH